MRILPIVLTASIAGIAVLAPSTADAQSRNSRTERRYDSGQNWQSNRNAGDVYVAGRNMGTDPDPRIRAQIMRDIGAAVGGKD
jgi:hypothetical protein